MSHYDGNSPYRFERDIRKQRSRDGYVRVIDGTARGKSAFPGIDCVTCVGVVAYDPNLKETVEKDHGRHLIGVSEGT